MIVIDEMRHTHSIALDVCFCVATNQLHSQARFYKIHELRRKANKEHTFNRLNLAFDQPRELRNTDNNNNDMYQLLKE
jgi:hypothetical protein